jgi:hypothetical protein
MFGLVEEFILPFLMDHIRPQLPNDDDIAVRALLQFAAEEAKHIQLFKRFHTAFVQGFGQGCQVIGPPAAIAKEVLSHEPLSVAMTILMVEWLTQSHYLDSVRGHTELEPLFANLLRCHWIEESQHAKLDTLMVEAMAKGRSEEQLRDAVNGMFAIAGFLDVTFRTQAKYNLAALERAISRRLSTADRDALIDQQHQALRWTYLGSGLRHEKFRAAIGGLSVTQLNRIDAAAPNFC